MTYTKDEKGIYSDEVKIAAHEADLAEQLANARLELPALEARIAMLEGAASEYPVVEE